MVPGQSVNIQYLPSPLSDAITNLLKSKLWPDCELMVLLLAILIVSSISFKSHVHIVNNVGIVSCV